MSRHDGFEVADTDTGQMSDPKILSLARRLRDPIRTGAAVTLYDSVRLASWKAGRRLTLDEALPGWWLDPVDEFAEDLIAVKLLDDERRIPAHAWEGWFTPAWNRRERYRELGSRGGLAKAARSSDPDPSVRSTAGSTARSSPSVPTVRQTVPTVPTAPNAPNAHTNGNEVTWTNFKRGDCQRFRAAWEARGFRYEPSGSTDDPESQAGILWEIVDARPIDLARWVAEAPQGSKPYAVVQYALAQWRDVKVSAS